MRWNMERVHTLTYENCQQQVPGIQPHNLKDGRIGERLN